MQLSALCIRHLHISNNAPYLPPPPPPRFLPKFCKSFVFHYSWVLPNFIPRGGLALPDFPGLFEKSSFKMADSQRLVRVKTRTKPSFFEEILINIPSKNLPKLSKERTQYFCHALKLNLRSRHSATRAGIVRRTGRSNQR